MALLVKSHVTNRLALPRIKVEIAATNIATFSTTGLYAAEVLFIERSCLALPITGRHSPDIATGFLARRCGSIRRR
ncbi:hypothetical protein Vau01_122800 [Virgisporangium aurantiacum]|uniref:Uncharacterized protein n=2 Tax=Virgisporangium aurantiacum TaxID=175570 RepID=A0A8J4E7X1_9ACTN|nr:hypothetical protein Vau01_122800 [Virgisporangium aurantiacum]